MKDKEYRVGITPPGVRALTGQGHRVLVEKEAGEGSAIPDAEYERAGALMVSRRETVYRDAELIVKVKELLPSEYEFLQKGQVLFSFLHLAANLSLTQRLLEGEVSAIAYETVSLDDGALPLLKPMSEIAGRLAVQHGAYYLQRMLGGRGILLSGVPGVERGRVVVLGGGTVGYNGARIAVGLGARVMVLDVNVERLRGIDEDFAGQVETEVAHQDTIRDRVLEADLVLGAVLVTGARAPVLVDRRLLTQMKKGSVVVDVAIDQGGCFETSRPTSHSSPVYLEEGVVHYCVPNIPGAVPRTATFALVNMTLPYVQKIAGQGLEAALKADPALRQGLNIHAGTVTHPGVAQAHGMKVHTYPA